MMFLVQLFPKRQKIDTTSFDESDSADLHHINTSHCRRVSGDDVQKLSADTKCLSFIEFNAGGDWCQICAIFVLFPRDADPLIQSLHPGMTHFQWRFCTAYGARVSSIGEILLGHR
ncbi:hypothetical protein QJS10_CPB15g00906 [Acorus calamus]|uniref:Uncharacterized protein n=1 Tax=Acorus calamus TaxID=4465 RepID=A0AAV9D6M5_ACOCL|nr:hypothetical protein QJS10_CPB15g00906 [Acorus calamus]